MFWLVLMYCGKVLTSIFLNIQRYLDRRVKASAIFGYCWIG